MLHLEKVSLLAAFLELLYIDVLTLKDLLALAGDEVVDFVQVVDVA